ncbi:MAG: serine/threonine-protein kinase, partial [Kofleriaceae bacterium]
MKPGDVIDGKYQVETELGEGGMGRVLAARHLTLGSAVAIKVLRSDSLEYPDVPRRFLREARAAGRLRSEHVVKVTDVGELATGEPYMVMERLHGFDLSSRIKEGPVAPALAVEYIAQACEGLAEAHAMGMVHRDVKPANLFVTQRPNGAPLVKVLDFGIATAATGDVDHNLTTTLTVIGSPSYMSPEQLHAARDVDARSDIWSLGVTLYELVSGRQPFLGPTITALTLKIVGEPHERLPGASPELAAIVDRCLAKQREDRYANVAELVRALAPLFPNGRVAAEMVAGSLSHVPAPSVAALGGSTIGVDPTAYPVAPAAPVKSTTTDLGAGESAAPIERAGKQYRTWVVVGAVLAAAIVAFGLVVSQRGDADPPASPSAATAAPPVDLVEPPREPGSGGAMPSGRVDASGDPAVGAVAAGASARGDATPT